MVVVTEVLAGLATSLALVPEATAFSLAVGVEPIVGLHAAIVMCITCAVLGGQPAMISGASGAVACVLSGVVATLGKEYLFLAVLVGGIVEITIAMFKAHRLFAIVPPGAISGFLVGLAVLIFLGLGNSFKTESGKWLTGSSLATSVVVTLLCAVAILVIEFIKKQKQKPRARDKDKEHDGRKIEERDRSYLERLKEAALDIPSTLVVMVALTVIHAFVPLPLKTIGDYSKLGGAMPSFHVPNVPLNLGSLVKVLPFSIGMALSGLLESILTLKKLDHTLARHGDARRETFAQGVGNVLCGLTSGMGGSVLVGESTLNISFGGKTRLSSLVAGVGLLCIVLFFSRYVEKIPIAAIVSVMLYIIYKTCDWTSIINLPKADLTALIVVITAVSSVALGNLAVGAGIGTVVYYIAMEAKRRRRPPPATTALGT